jgi:cobalt/nickel transport system permease protein
LDRTLRSVTAVGRQALFSEAAAAEQGLLQAVDPRVKMVTFLVVLIAISMLHHPLSLLFLSGLALVLALLSHIRPIFFLSRVWLVVPLFSAAIVLPSLLNIVTPGEPLVVLARLDGDRTLGPLVIPSEITITRQGLRGAVLFLSRVGASVSFAILFTLTTKWSQVFAGLRSLKVPRVFVMTLSMTERYLFVFLGMIQDMYRARMSRTIHPLPARKERHWTASRIGVTFKKTLDMSEDIYKAMLARGFQGEFRALDRLHLSIRDLVWSLSVLSVPAILALLERGLLGK